METAYVGALVQLQHCTLEGFVTSRLVRGGAGPLASLAESVGIEGVIILRVLFPDGTKGEFLETSLSRVEKSLHCRHCGHDHSKSLSCPWPSAIGKSYLDKKIQEDSLWDTWH